MVLFLQISLSLFFCLYSGHLRLSDFGLSRRLKRGGRAFTICGTIQYMDEICGRATDTLWLFSMTNINMRASPAFHSPWIQLTQLWMGCTCNVLCMLLLFALLLRGIFCPAFNFFLLCTHIYINIYVDVWISVLGEQLLKSWAGVRTTMLLTGGLLGLCCSHWRQERWRHLNSLFHGSVCRKVPESADYFCFKSTCFSIFSFH